MAAVFETFVATADAFIRFSEPVVLRTVYAIVRLPSCGGGMPLGGQGARTAATRRCSRPLRLLAPTRARCALSVLLLHTIAVLSAVISGTLLLLPPRSRQIVPTTRLSLSVLGAPLWPPRAYSPQPAMHCCWY